MNRITSLRIQGYRPFRDFTASFGELEVLVGANGSGKSALFEFLRFLRDGMHHNIPPEIVAGSSGQQIFHLPGPPRIWWSIDMDLGRPHLLRYQGELQGPIGRTRLSFERVLTVPPEDMKPLVFLDIQEQQGMLFRDEHGAHREETIDKRPNQLALSIITNPKLVTLFGLREYIMGWRFYSAFNVSNHKIRQAVPVEQDPILHEDAGNLSAVLFNLMTEHQQVFNDLQQFLRSLIPGFRGLTIKARGAPGQVIAFWSEGGLDDDLTLADLSDGILRLLCWTVLAVHPTPPPLICIDEPDQGVHPRTLPILAGLFQKASQRTQILLATHASYFLTQFGLDRLAVMRKEEGRAQFIKPGDSAIMRDMLDDFGALDLEHLHRSDELESLP